MGSYRRPHHSITVSAEMTTNMTSSITRKLPPHPRKPSPLCRGERCALRRQSNKLSGKLRQLEPSVYRPTWIIPEFWEHSRHDLSPAFTSLILEHCTLRHLVQPNLYPLWVVAHRRSLQELLSRVLGRILSVATDEPGTDRLVDLPRGHVLYPRSRAHFLQR